MAKFEGLFAMESSDNFDNYLKKLGVSMMLRTVAGKTKPDMEIKIDGDTYTMKSISTFKTTELKFQLGVEFDEETADGRKMKTTMTIDGNKLIQTQKATKKDALDSVITREFTAEGFTATCVADDVTAVRVYKRK